ncbi:GNAT family N-acetyltransferase [Roseomonas hellenica]|uniref:GNAT family N-acetyltransferase n=1 Tax=Plastoroseomonas hellenica TaxID=2687306 RepID=A0ABS5EXB6_9PROT|nr:GNAT family N-acetyltransferase [Plastoroseomonas hellenica]MBR0664941.1 GNAT family N-acetyltransferase [Plastoroseomonas hellenica]
MIIRPASAADAGIVAGFVDALLVELSGAPSRPEARLRMAAELLAGDDRVFGFLAFAGEAPVGVIMLAESVAIYAGGAFGVITELYVVPEQRSAGVAKRLVAAALDFGRSRSWGRVEVGAPHQPAWERSFRFYLREGFTEVGPRLKFLL